jgi:hypothetical protein
VAGAVIVEFAGTFESGPTAVPPCESNVTAYVGVLATVMLKTRQPSDVPTEFVAAMEKAKVPAVVGVPESTPLLLMLSPPEAPEIENPVGEFVAVIFAEYAVPTVPPGSETAFTTGSFCQ